MGSLSFLWKCVAMGGGGAQIRGRHRISAAAWPLPSPGLHGADHPGRGSPIHDCNLRKPVLVPLISGLRWDPGAVRSVLGGGQSSIIQARCRRDDARAQYEMLFCVEGRSVIGDRLRVPLSICSGCFPCGGGYVETETLSRALCFVDGRAPVSPALSLVAHQALVNPLFIHACALRISGWFLIPTSCFPGSALAAGRKCSCCCP